MAERSRIHNRMRTWHRYLGYFLSGIMAVYAISGIVMIFRDTDFLKREKRVEQQLRPGLSVEELGKALRIRNLEIIAQDSDRIVFKQGSYHTTTAVMEKLTRLHKATSHCFGSMYSSASHCCFSWFRRSGCSSLKQRSFARVCILHWQDCYWHWYCCGFSLII